jgi:LysR family glycine cleavage system transcriptional activator
MTSRLPSLRAVAVFVAAGRALSFTEAAKVVNLTPSGVSRRVSDLEHELGVALFRRFNRRLELTDAGARLLAAASEAIDLIARESEAIRPRRSDMTLRLSVLQSFATMWLVPRLAALKIARPEFSVQIETSTDLVDLSDDRFDAAIRFGRGHWPGLCAERVFKVRAFPVTAPQRTGKPGVISAAALDRTVLLGIAQVPDLWPQYLSAVGLARYQPRRTETFDNVQIMYEAAANGLGLALAAHELVDGLLASGRLVEAFTNEPVTLRQSYYLVYRKDRRDQPALRMLRKVLTEDARLR